MIIDHKKTSYRKDWSIRIYIYYLFSLYINVRLILKLQMIPFTNILYSDR